MDDDTVIYADRIELKRASRPQLIAEILRLRNLLDECWAAAGLLGSGMTGQPAQAWETPSDLVDQIYDLASDAENYRELQSDTPTA